MSIFVEHGACQNANGRVGICGPAKTSSLPDTRALYAIETNHPPDIISAYQAKPHGQPANFSTIHGGQSEEI
jgi:hypothetical protein